jgi:TetR/AcrR family transcriptional repressor of nem operon
MDEVLAGAMNTFWQKGYAATSIRELVQATGLTTRSLYNLFESKEGLFQASLERYRSENCADLYRTLSDNRGRDGIVKVFDRLARMELKGGCFMVRTLNEQNLLEDHCVASARAHFKKIERLFKQKLEEMREDGQFAGDPADTARALLLVMQGASSYGQDPRSAKSLPRVVGAILGAMGIT